MTSMIIIWVVCTFAPEARRRTWAVSEITHSYSFLAVAGHLGQVEHGSTCWQQKQSVVVVGRSTLEI